MSIGWDLNELAAADGGRTYQLTGLSLYSPQFITVTLAWDRVLDEREVDGGAGDGVVEPGDTYVDRAAAGDDLGVLPDFNLYIYKDGNVIAQSVASSVGLDGDNVEHLHLPAEPESSYSIRVTLAGAGTRQYEYALAWWAQQDTE